MTRAVITKALLGAALVLSTGAGPPAPSPLTFDEHQKKRIEARRTDKPPVIDGKLDDACWADAVPDDSFRQRYPHDGDAPTQHTTIRVVYDDTAIYLGVRMDDTDPQRIVARLARRDRQVESDQLGIALDSRHDHATAYAFYLNAAGVQSDALLFDDNQSTFDWDAVWDGASTRDEHGWSAEFRIPLSALRFSDLPVQEWGFQVERYISRNQERDRWTYTPQTMSAEVSPMGHLVGLEGLHPRHALELRPFVVAKARTHTDAGGAAFGLDPRARVDEDLAGGLDAKVGLTSNLVLDASLYPDFGQVDADQVVLNLSHFETFFPEKRPFFLEGTDLFTTPLGMFYSRRIGRASVAPDSFTAADGSTTLTTIERPSAAPIVGALKLSGKVTDALSVGALDAVTGSDDATAIDPTGMGARYRFLVPMNYAVARAKYAVRGSSFVGAMATAVTRLEGGGGRDAALDHDGYTQDLDGVWRSSDTKWRLAGQLVASERVGGATLRDGDGLTCDPATRTDCRPITRNDGQKLLPGDVGYGADLEAAYEGPTWLGSLTARILTPKLGLNDLGFWTTYDRYELDYNLKLRDTAPGDVFQKWIAGVGGDVVYSFDGTLRDVTIGAGFAATLKSFWSFDIEPFINVPGTWDHYETQDGGWFQKPFGPGLWMSLDSDVRRPVQLHFETWTNFGFSEGGWEVGSAAALKVNLISTLEFELDPNVDFTGGDRMRAWFPAPCLDDGGNPCTPDTMARHYRFGALETGSVSLTTRLGYAFSPRLSLQAYAQLFFDRGHWSRYARVDTTGLSPFIRYRDLVPDPGFNGDSDGDGIRDDDFEDVSLNVNVVLRWEYSPGATVLLVYTRSQASDLVLAGEVPHLTPRGITTGPTEDIFLMKLTYFLGS